MIFIRLYSTLAALSWIDGRVRRAHHQLVSRTFRSWTAGESGAKASFHPPVSSAESSVSRYSGLDYLCF